MFYSVEEYTGALCPFDQKRITLSPLYKGILLLSEETDSSHNIFQVDKNQLTHAFAFPKSDTLFQDIAYNDLVKLDDGNFLATTNSVEQAQRKLLFNSRGEILDIFSCPHMDSQRASRDMTVLKERLFYVCRENPGTDPRTSPIFIYEDNQKLDKQSHLPYGFYYINEDKIYVLGYKRDHIRIYDWDPIKLQHRINLGRPIANDTPWYMFSDNQGGIWYTEGNEIWRLSLRKEIFERPLPEDTLKTRQVRGMATSPEGTIYAGTFDKLYTYPNDKSERKVGIELYACCANGILYDQGPLWITTDGEQEIRQYFPDTGERISYPIQEGRWLPGR